MDGRFGVPAMLRQLADSIEDGAIPVRNVYISYLEPEAEDIASGDADPNDVTLSISIGTVKPSVPVPSVFYTGGE